MKLAKFPGQSLKHRSANVQLAKGGRFVAVMNRRIDRSIRKRLMHGEDDILSATHHGEEVTHDRNSGIRRAHCLSGTPTEQDNAEGFEKDLYIEPERPVLSIIKL